MNLGKKLPALLLLPALLITGASAAAPDNAAGSAILVDCDSGRVLYEKNADEERLIASTTKLMTALVAIESTPDTQQVVEIRPEWTGAEGTSLYLESGQEWRLETLLYGLLLHSGNDAAVAIAGFCAGDTETFVDWMNQRAADLDMTHTHFENPNGLNHEMHYSTAADMAKLAVACLQNPLLADIVSTKSISLEGRTFTNHNKLLWRYEGCVGLKTGYTEMAGRTLVSAATRNGQTLAVVTLRDPDDWDDHAKLLDYGFETYEKQLYGQAGEIYESLPVEGSLQHSVSLRLAQELSYPLSQEERAQVHLELVLPEFVSAPIQSGGIAGSVALCRGDEVLDESYLLYGQDVQRDVLAGNEQVREFLGRSRDEKRRVYLPPTQDEEATARAWMMTGKT